MPESTLSLRLSDFQSSVGLFLGFGRGTSAGDTAWSTQQQAAIDECVKSGLRSFYFPPPLMEGGPSHDWSFLHPVASLTLPSGQQVADLPDDFGGIEGEITLSNSNLAAISIPVTGEGVIRQKYFELPSASGQPVIAAVQPVKGTNAVHGQRFRLFIWPAADQAYTLAFAYFILADALSGDRPYAYGGMMHAETILESCLSIAEERLDDSMGVHKIKFMERLAASINMDRRLKPQHIGVSVDLSDETNTVSGYPHGWSSVTYKNAAMG